MLYREAGYNIDIGDQERFSHLGSLMIASYANFSLKLYPDSDC